MSFAKMKVTIENKYIKNITNQLVFTYFITKIQRNIISFITISRQLDNAIIFNSGAAKEQMFLLDIKVFSTYALQLYITRRLDMWRLHQSSFHQRSRYRRSALSNLLLFYYCLKKRFNKSILLTVYKSHTDIERITILS